MRRGFYFPGLVFTCCKMVAGSLFAAVQGRLCSHVGPAGQIRAPSGP